MSEKSVESRVGGSNRFAGILAHPTSFPSPYGIGDLGEGAYKFIDFLASSGQKLWQLLPLGPTGYGDSPYQSFSSFAGQPLIISPDDLLSLELLTKSDLKSMPKWNALKVDYGPAIIFKTELLKKAFGRFLVTKNKKLISEYETFCKKENSWLLDYSLFMSIKDFHGGVSWLDWKKKYKFPTEESKETWQKEFEESIKYYNFIQFIFFREWYKLKEYANKKGIKVVGDIPIFVSSDSSDVWANKELFQLDSKGFPTVVAGVPPDYFSATGQLWGNPLYDWEANKKEGYAWWINRIKSQLTMVDYLRIDHFRGFEAYWAIPYGEKTAINGKWLKGPCEDLFYAIEKELGENLPIIAEDLGLITPEVLKLRDTFNFPGMKVLQFGFDNTEENDFLPHYYNENCVCYTGTHDNDTTLGWYKGASRASKIKIKKYMHTDAENVSWDFIRVCLGCVAKFAIVPFQDYLSLGTKARMNTPGVADNNWAWRFKEDVLTKELAKEINRTVELFGRK